MTDTTTTLEIDRMWLEIPQDRWPAHTCEQGTFPDGYLGGLLSKDNGPCLRCQMNIALYTTKTKHDPKIAKTH